MDYFNDFWLGTITAEFINQCVHQAAISCSGCRDGKHSPLLHMCQHQGLESKLVTYMELIRGNLLPRIPEIFEKFQLNIENANLDRDTYVTNARFFLVQATAQSIYYGSFLNERNDAFIHHQLTYAAQEMQPPPTSPKTIANPEFQSFGIKKRRKSRKITSRDNELPNATC